MKLNVASARLAKTARNEIRSVLCDSCLPLANAKSGAAGSLCIQRTPLQCT